MNTKLKAGLALSALFLIGFLSGYLFSGLMTADAPSPDRWSERGEQLRMMDRERALLERFDGDSTRIRELRMRFAERLQQERMQQRGPDRPPQNRRMDQERIGRIVRSLDSLSNADKREVFQMLLQFRRDVGDFLRDNRNYEMEQIRSRYDELMQELTPLLSNEELQRINSYIHPDSSRVYSRRVPPRVPMNQQPEP